MLVVLGKEQKHHTRAIMIRLLLRITFKYVKCRAQIEMILLFLFYFESTSAENYIAGVLYMYAFAKSIIFNNTKA